MTKSKYYPMFEEIGHRLLGESLLMQVCTRHSGSGTLARALIRFQNKWDELKEVMEREVAKVKILPCEGSHS
jgi:hypothetical protein